MSARRRSPTSSASTCWTRRSTAASPRRRSPHPSDSGGRPTSRCRRAAPRPWRSRASSTCTRSTPRRPTRWSRAAPSSPPAGPSNSGSPGTGPARSGSRSTASTPRWPYRSRPAASPSASRSSPGTGAWTPSPPTTSCSPRRSRPAPPSASTTPAASPANVRPRSPSSAACSPANSRPPPPWRPPRGICRRRVPGSAATGST